MENSKNFGFYLPSSDTDDIADVNFISDNFRLADERVVDKKTVDLEALKKLSLSGNGRVQLPYTVPYDNRDLVTKKYVDDRSSNVKGDIFANALKGSKSGEVVAIDDVSPIEHDVKVKLTSDTITDFSNVTVSRYGKNFLDYTKATDRRGNPLTIIDGGVLWDKNIDWNFNIPVSVPSGVAVAFSCKSDYPENPDYIYSYQLMYIDGTNDYKALDSGTPYIITKNEVTAVLLRKNKTSVIETQPIKVTDIQLECGKFPTPYEPFKEPQTVTANADGTVEGIKSISPNMTLMSYEINEENDSPYVKITEEPSDWATNWGNYYFGTADNPNWITISDYTSGTYVDFESAESIALENNYYIYREKGTYDVIINAEYNRDINKAFAKLEQAILNM